MDPAEAFAPEGVVAVVGAGGKKSTLYALATDLDRSVLTATVRIPPFEGHVAQLAVTDAPVEALGSNDTWPWGVVPGRDGDRDRYLGYDIDVVDRMADATDVPILVKADGARGRWVKAPADNEPQIPLSARLVIPVASVRAVGEPLDDGNVHRPERVAAVTGLEPGDGIDPADVATVLTHPAGGLKDVPDGATVRPLLNMVDDAELESTAREIAAEVVAHQRVDAVVLGRIDLRVIVDVVT
jgi:probable selenium-dependent hydroxylase accessory protein YqeC